MHRARCTSVSKTAGARSRTASDRAQNGSGSVSMQTLGIEVTNSTSVARSPVSTAATTSSSSNAAAVGGGVTGGAAFRPGGVVHVQSKAVAPLHLRMVTDVDFAVYPFSLIFCDPALEMDYLKCAAARVPRHVRRAALMLILLFGISIAFDAVQYTAAAPNNESVYLTRLILTAVCFALALALAALSALSIPYHPLPQGLFTLLLTVQGALWAVASVFENGELVRGPQAELRATECSGILMWILIVHGTGRFMYFHLSCIPSGVAAIVFVITSVIWSSAREERIRVAWACMLVLAGAGVGWFVSYRLELLKRWSHLTALQVELGRREKADLRKEAFDLRDEMYVMTLERYDIADVAGNQKELEFKSPMEQAMAKLQSLSENKSLPKDAFLDVQKIIGLLGNSSDVFKVQVSEALADKNIRLDDETTRYLFDLMNDNNYEEAPAGGAGAGAGVAGAAGGTATIAPPHSARTSVSHVKGANSNGGLITSASDDSPDLIEPTVPGIGSGGGVGAGGDPATASLALERSATRLTLPGQASTLNVPTSVLAKEERQVNDLLKGMDTYNFDVFEVATLTNGKPLFFVGTALFKKYNLLQKFRIDRTKLGNFLNVIENGYLKTNPYHNGIHASDVARTVHYFLHTSMRAYTSDLEILALIIASLIHDFDHPGKTNQFHIAIRDPKAILYNDRAVLENHHCAQAFFLLHKDENNIFSELSAKDYAQVRKLIVELVLATDLGAHFDFLAQFKSSQSSGALDSSGDKLVTGPTAQASRLMIHKMALKCGDLGHASKTRALHEKWTLRITEEFYRQGDEERKRGIAISPFMDRQKANLPQSQVGFLDFLVMPMFTAWVKFLELDEGACPLMEQLRGNKEHWKSQLEQHSHSGGVTTPAAAATNAPPVANPPPATAAAEANNKDHALTIASPSTDAERKEEKNSAAH